MVEGASPARVGHAARHLDGPRAAPPRARLAGAVAVPHGGGARATRWPGSAWGASVDIAAAQLVAREAGLLVGAARRPRRCPGTPLDLDDPLPRAGRPRRGRPCALLSPAALAPSATAASG